MKQSECPFCFKTYGDAEEHHCPEEEMWRDTLIGQATEARKALEEFCNVVMTEAEKSFKILNDMWRKKK